MKTLTERINYLSYIFELLQDTNSINEKQDIIKHIEPDVKDDFEYILEILAGRHKLGYKYPEHFTHLEKVPDYIEQLTFREYIAPLFVPLTIKDLSEHNIGKHISKVIWFPEFVEPIVNRTLRLGIGQSVLPKDGLSTMLAKAYDGKLEPDDNGYYITEKLDGNRCVARFDGTKWLFTSRNGKPMHVDIDMTGLPTEFVYDGELLSVAQNEASIKLHMLMQSCEKPRQLYKNEFNSTSGMINRHSTDKKLVYNIFDVMIDNTPYYIRRDILDDIENKIDSKEVRILPLLKWSSYNIHHDLPKLLDYVSACGAEGLMINLASKNYEHKRTNSLLKFKQVKTADLRVIDWESGEGKYYNMVGALICEAKVDGKHIICKVGSGMTDEQRFEWYLQPKDIVGKIVEVAYFSLSQDKDSLGTNTYSLRFPRLKSVRKDKNLTSIY